MEGWPCQHACSHMGFRFQSQWFFPLLAESEEGRMRFSTFSGCGSLPSTVTSWEGFCLPGHFPRGPCPSGCKDSHQNHHFFLTMTNPIWNVYKIRQNMAGSATALGLGDPFTCLLEGLLFPAWVSSRWRSQGCYAE